MSERGEPINFHGSPADGGKVQHRNRTCPTRTVTPLRRTLTTLVTGLFALAVVAAGIGAVFGSSEPARPPVMPTSSAPSSN
jgi:hypothetical protein